MIKANFSVGDVVYVASKDGIEKEIIDAIKVTGLEQNVKYGFKQDCDGYLMFYSSREPFSWYAESRVFATKKEASAHSTFLKASAEIREEKKKKLKAELNKLDEED